MPRPPRRHAALKLLLDESAADKKVGSAVRNALKGEREPKLAVAYVGGGFKRLLGLPRSATGWLLCDPFTGGCDPEELTLLSDAGWRISCLRGLHAKVYITASRVIIGSPNISVSALNQGNIEAAVTLSDTPSITETNDWFERVFRKGRPFDEIQNSPHEIARIRAFYARRVGAWVSVKTGKVPTLAEALADPAFDWDRYVFTLLDSENVDETRAEAAATNARVALEDDDYTFDETPADGNGPTIIQKCEDATRGNKRVIGAWVVSTGKAPYTVTKFRTIEDYASIFEVATEEQGVVYCFYRTVPPGELNVSLEGSDVGETLTRGLAATGERLSVLEYVPGTTIARIFQAGMAAGGVRDPTMG